MPLDKMLKRYLQSNTEKSLERPEISIGGWDPEIEAKRGQPPSKISAVPGRSGSSGVFRDSSVPVTLPPPKSEDKPYSGRVGSPQGYRDEEDPISDFLRSNPTVYFDEMRDAERQAWNERLGQATDEIQGPRPSLRSKRTMAIRKSHPPGDFTNYIQNKEQPFDLTKDNPKVTISKRLKVLGTEKMIQK